MVRFVIKGSSVEIEQVFQKKIQQIGRMTVTGGALTTAGLFITKGLDATLKAARELVRAQKDFRTLNLSVHDNATFTIQAHLLSHQTSSTTIIKTLSEASGTVNVYRDEGVSFHLTDAGYKQGEKTGNQLLSWMANRCKSRLRNKNGSGHSA